MKHINESIIGRKGNGNSAMFAGSPKTVFHILLFRDDDVDLFKYAAERVFDISRHHHRGEDLARIHIGKPIECRIYKTTFGDVGSINNYTSIDMTNGNFDPDEYYDRRSFTLIYSGKKYF